MKSIQNLFTRTNSVNHSFFERATRWWVAIRMKHNKTLITTWVPPIPYTNFGWMYILITLRVGVLGKSQGSEPWGSEFNSRCWQGGFFGPCGPPGAVTIKSENPLTPNRNQSRFGTVSVGRLALLDFSGRRPPPPWTGVMVA